MGKIAFIYPGQGAQKCFMGQDFYNMYPKCAEIFDKAEEALDVSVKDLCFRENPLLYKSVIICDKLEIEEDEFENYHIAQGSKAIDVSTGNKYRITSSGSWKLQSGGDS